MSRPPDPVPDRPGPKDLGHFRQKPAKGQTLYPFQDSTFAAAAWVLVEAAPAVVRSLLGPKIVYAPLRAVTWVQRARELFGRNAAGSLGIGNWMEGSLVVDRLKVMKVAAWRFHCQKLVSTSP